MLKKKKKVKFEIPIITAKNCNIPMLSTVSSRNLKQSLILATTKNINTIPEKTAQS